MTIAQTLKLAAEKLSKAKIKLPHLEAEILLSGIINRPREFLLAHGEKKLTESQISNFQFKISWRLKGEPAAYLTGQKEFYGLNFLVNKNVLIPRPETELMVEETIKLITRNWRLGIRLPFLTDPKQNEQPLTIIDLGAGSGCIIISLIKNLITKFPISNFQFLAIDISKPALSVAKRNARAHNVNKKIQFINGDLLSPLIHSSLAADSLIILANLPYGRKAWKNNCSLHTVGLKFEPEIALFTSKGGLALYERLFKQIKKIKMAAGSYVLGEFDPRQTKLLKTLLKKYFPGAKFEIKKDLAGLNRLFILTFDQLISPKS